MMCAVLTVSLGCMEGEPNDWIPEAQENNFVLFDKTLSYFEDTNTAIPGLPQLYSGTLEGASTSTNRDIWIIKTVRESNNIEFRVSLSQNTCVKGSVEKCTQAGITEWSQCPNSKKVTHFLDYGFCVGQGGGDAIFPVRMSIGKDKLIKLRVSHLLGFSSNAFYSFGLQSN